ncbi:MAG: SCO family protein [Casimicrobium sp.]
MMLFLAQRLQAHRQIFRQEVRGRAPRASHYMLRLWTACCICFGLIACSEPPGGFNAIDVTGAAFAKAFELRDSDGKPRKLSDFQGKVVLLFFGFTQCPDVCPTALTRASAVKKQLGSDGEKLAVIFVTIDPERDTPAMLKEHTAAFDPSFVGLHADLKTTAETAAAFRIFYAKVPTGASYTMDHTATSYVYDPQGRLRLAAPHALSADALAADIRALLKTP